MSETLLNEIRATRPEAPPRCASACARCAPQEPAHEPFLDRIRVHGGALVLVVPATLVVALARRGRDRPVARQAAERRRPAQCRLRDERRGDRARRGASTAEPGARATKRRRRRSGAARSRPAPGQLPALRGRARPPVDDVDALSDATKQAHRSRATSAATSSRSPYDAPAEGVGAGPDHACGSRPPRSRRARASCRSSGRSSASATGSRTCRQQVDSLRPRSSRRSAGSRRSWRSSASPTLCRREPRRPRSRA